MLRWQEAGQLPLQAGSRCTPPERTIARALDLPLTPRSVPPHGLVDAAPNRTTTTESSSPIADWTIPCGVVHLGVPVLYVRLVGPGRG